MPSRHYICWTDDVESVSRDLLLLSQGMETDKLDDTYQRYLAPGIALFEVVDDDLLPLRPLGIQVIPRLNSCTD